jgi:hypothetical protein
MPNGCENQINIDNGVVYIAFGEKYHAEAKRSITSLKKVSAVNIAVITDKRWTDNPQPDFFVIRDKSKSFRSKPLYTYNATPFVNSLFIDTDTIIAKDINHVFGLLKHYDVGVCFGGAQLNENDGLEFHSQCNSGVILFRKCAHVEELFNEWLDLYDKAVAKISASDVRGVGDQRYLAHAIAKSKARPVHLGTFLNFALFDTITSCSPPIIYHGRNPWIEQLADNINNSWTQKVDWYPRVWLPNISGFLPRGVRRSDPLLAISLILRRIYNELSLRFWR